MALDATDSSILGAAFFAGFLAGLRNRYDEFDGITDVPSKDGQEELKEDIDIEIEDQIHQAEVLFIRAPKIGKVGNSVNVISKYQNEIVAVRSGIHFGFTFHPELNEVTFLHHHIFTNKTKYHKENNAA